MAQTCQTHSDQGKTFQKQKKKKEGAACHLRMHTHTYKKKSLVDTSDALAVNWGGEKTSPSSLSRLPPNQNLINKQRRKCFSKQKFEHKAGNKPSERQACPCNTYNQSIVGLRFKTAIPTKWRRERGVGAWAIHGIWWIDFSSIF